jgi:hypothetical protein
MLVATRGDRVWEADETFVQPPDRERRVGRHAGVGTILTMTPRAVIADVDASSPC